MKAKERKQQLHAQHDMYFVLLVISLCFTVCCCTVPVPVAAVVPQSGASPTPSGKFTVNKHVDEVLCVILFYSFGSHSF